MRARTKLSTALILSDGREYNVLVTFGSDRSARRIENLPRGLSAKLAHQIETGEVTAVIWPAPPVWQNGKPIKHRRVIARNGRLYCRMP